METQTVIVNCLERKDGVKMCIIPKRSKIKKDQQVIVTNDLTLINKFLGEQNG